MLVGEERALDNDTWLGLEILVTSWVWLVTEDCLLRAPWKEVPLLKVLTTSICNGGKNETSCLKYGHSCITDRNNHEKQQITRAHASTSLESRCSFSVIVEIIQIFCLDKTRQLRRRQWSCVALNSRKFEITVLAMFKPFYLEVNKISWNTWYNWSPLFFFPTENKLCCYVSPGGEKFSHSIGIWGRGTGMTLNQNRKTLKFNIWLHFVYKPRVVVVNSSKLVW